jgi:hypothetical protein
VKCKERWKSPVLSCTEDSDKELLREMDLEADKLAVELSREVPLNKAV